MLGGVGRARGFAIDRIQRETSVVIFRRNVVYRVALNPHGYGRADNTILRNDREKCIRIGSSLRPSVVMQFRPRRWRRRGDVTLRFWHDRNWDLILTGITRVSVTVESSRVAPPDRSRSISLISETVERSNRAPRGNRPY